MKNVISVQLKKEETILKIAETAEQKDIMQTLRKKLPELKKMYKTEKIPIKVTGLRPGEKLYEELLMQGEGLKTTAHNKIFIGDIEDITEEQLEEKIAILKEIIQDENIEKEKIRQIMKKIVPTYHEPEEVNTSIKNSRKELGEKAKSKQTKAEVATA